jgi:hypothetical protein
MWRRAKQCDEKHSSPNEDTEIARFASAASHKRRIHLKLCTYDVKAYLNKSAVVNCRKNESDVYNCRNLETRPVAWQSGAQHCLLQPKDLAVVSKLGNDLI